MNRTINRTSYIGLSVAIACLMIFTALPYYTVTSLAFPGYNVFLSYASIQTSMLILFPGLAFLGAITTLGKRNTGRDIFINVAMPMVLLITLIFSEKYCRCKGKRRIQLIYYTVRNKGVPLLLILLTPNQGFRSLRKWSPTACRI